MRNESHVMRLPGLVLLSIWMVLALAGCESVTSRSFAFYWTEFLEFTNLESAFNLAPESASELTLAVIRGGVAKDTQPAAVEKWIKRAKGGNTSAMFSLGLAYQMGLGVAPDPAKAYQWYALAVDRGNMLAGHNIGTMFGTGQGTPRDLLQAYKWFSLATEKLPASREHNVAVTNREKVAKVLSTADISEGHRQARAWAPRMGAVIAFEVDNGDIIMDN